MSGSLLSRPATARVLQSLLSTELSMSRGQREEATLGLASPWPEELLLAGHADPLEYASLGCDSLEILLLSAATNQMFHLHEAEGDSDLLGAKTFGQWIDCVEAAWQHGVNTVTFSTSGSTGVPKRCPQPFAHLQLEVAFLKDFFSKRRRVLGLTPTHHIYGFLFVAMLPDALGHTKHPSCGTLESLARRVRPGDLVVASPAYWNWLDRTISTWPEDVEGVTSTGSCPSALIESLLSKGLRGMTEIYGSSETSGVGLRKWPAERYCLMPHWSSPLRQNNGDAPLLTSSLGRQVSLMDNVEVDEEDTFIVLGRRDSAVQVGGTNVFPSRIATLLGARPGVKSAAVRLMRATEGNRLKAFVVPEFGEDEEVLLRALQSWIALNLPVAERPTAIQFGTALPLTRLGKDADW